MPKHCASIAFLVGLAASVASAWVSAQEGGVPVRREWQVDGVKREALVCAPAAAKTTPSPVVFGFHGHGGTMQHASRTFSLHKHWPEAVVVYMQGLNTPGRLTDPEGKRPGWQAAAGDQNDRDLKFFDAVLASLQADFKIDEKRIYSMGHSNGGAFTYLLWAERGDVFAAVAPSGAVGGRQLRSLKPLPVFHLAGEKDELVKYEWQTMMIGRLRQLNECAEGEPWKNEKHCTLYASKRKAPVVTYIHGGGHAFPAEAAPVIIKFFKDHARP